jgi:hypothetical protein
VAPTAPTFASSAPLIANSGAPIAETPARDSGDDLARMFEGPAHESAREMTPIMSFAKYSGAVIAVADGWGSNVDSDDNNLIIWASDGDINSRNVGRLYVMAENVTSPGVEPYKFTESERTFPAYMAMARNVIWQPPTVGTRGAERAKVMIWCGVGTTTPPGKEPRRVCAFSTWAANKRVRGVGSWIPVRDRDRKAIVEMVKSIKG